MKRSSKKACKMKSSRFLVPTEEVIEVRRGKKVTAERRFMPGYLLVRMDSV